MPAGRTPSPLFQARFVTACQQVLALAVVCTALTPAVSVISLDVVSEPAAPEAGVALMAAYGQEALKTSKVPTGPVTAHLREVPLTPPVTGKATPQARMSAAPGGGARLTSVPQRVTGYGAVGVTWAHEEDVDETDLTLDVRTQTDGVWSGWTDLEYHDDHGPDPDSAEARHARPGTDALLVGRVDDVQVRAESDTYLPADMKLAVVNPGRAQHTAEERAALDTSTMDGNDGSRSAYDETALRAAEEEASQGDLALAAATYTPQPVIYSREQWGANENLRQRSALHYSEVHAGFVHHTVNANDYRPDEVPGILRSIYAYHTQSRGWSDIGYNYLVDKFGRIWEGRYGGVDRPVVGAHTLNYNENAFAMSAIGNYETAQPSAATLQAYGVLFAWKLSLHGVDAASPQQWVGRRYFEAVNGHRDAASTLCPGKNLYAQIPLIRQYAAAAQQGWTGRELESSIVATPYPDLLMRKKSDKQVYVLPTNGMTRFGAPTSLGGGWTPYDLTALVPDVSGDGIADLLARTAADGVTEVRPGDGNGAFGASIGTFSSLAGHDLITVAGDLDGDGHADLVARDPATGRLDALLGTGQSGFTVKQLGDSWGKYDVIDGPGDVNGDGRPDLVARGTEGAFYLVPGVPGVGFGNPERLGGTWQGYDTITGHGDFNGDGKVDLLVRAAGSSGVYVKPGRGNGRFGHPLGPIPGFGGITGLNAGASVSGAAAPDLVGRSGDSLVLFRNAGTYETGTPVASGLVLPRASEILSAGDWDRNGTGDMIVRNRKSDRLLLYRGDGAGHFTAPTLLARGFRGVKLLAAVGDMTGDGWPDLTGQPNGSPMLIYPNNGALGLRPAYPAFRRITAGAQVPVGRWDADGAPDSLFRTGKKLALYPGNGPGGFIGSKAFKLNVKRYDWMVGVGDMGINGHSGLVVREKKTGYLWVLPGTTTGFAPRVFLGQGFKGYDLAG